MYLPYSSATGPRYTYPPIAAKSPSGLWDLWIMGLRELPWGPPSVPGVDWVPSRFEKPKSGGTPGTSEPALRKFISSIETKLFALAIGVVVCEPTSPMYRSPVRRSKLARHGLRNPDATTSPNPEIGLPGLAVFQALIGLSAGMAKFFKLSAG